MDSVAFKAACHAAGVPRDVGAREFDALVAGKLLVTERTARRWRLGALAIPGPVKVALNMMMLLRPTQG